MAISKKKKLIYGAVTIITAAASYFLLRKREVKFYDTIWCKSADCCNISLTSSGYNQVECFSNAVGDSNEDFGQGYLNIVFLEPHRLKQGQVIYINQDEGASFDYYDGKTTVKEVINDRIIKVNKAYKGASPTIGGTIMVDSIINNWLNN